MRWLVLFVLFVEIDAPAMGQTTWSTTATSGQMTNDANWVGGLAPTDTNTAVWVFTNSSTTLLTNSFTSYTVNGILFTANATNASTGAGYILASAGNVFTLVGGITNQSTTNQAINTGLTINSAVTITNTANNSTAFVSLGGAITGSDTITFGAANSSSRLQFSGNNTNFSGALLANSGRVVFLNTNASSLNADYTFTNGTGDGVRLGNSSGVFNFGSLSGSSQIAANATNISVTLAAGHKGSNTTYSGNIASNNLGAGQTFSLTKMGAGTMTLTGNNTYNGTTTISNGVLQIGTGGTAGSISNSTSISLAGGSLAINRSDNVTQGVNFTGGALSGTGGFIQMGAGTTTLTAANTHTGSTVVSGGTLLLSNGSAIENSTLNMAGGSLLFDGALTAVTAGGLNGTGNLVLTNNSGAAVTLNLANAASSLSTDATIISGTGGLVLSGTGTQTFSGANTFSGGFVLNAGAKVRVGPSLATTAGGAVTDSSLGAGAITINGGTIFGSTGSVGSANTTINADFAVNEGAIGGLSGRLRLFGGFDMAGAERTVSLGRYTNSAAAVLTGGNESLRFETASGGPTTSFTNGTLRFVRDAAGGAGDYVGVRFDANTGLFYGGSGFVVGSNVITSLASSFVFNTFGSRPQVGVEAGGYFNLSDNANARDASIQSLSGAGTVTSLASAASTSTLTILPNSGDNGVFSGQIADGSSLTSLVPGAATTLALTLNGAGTQTLTGANTYTGATTITAGTLQIGNGGTTGSLNASGTIALGASGTLLFNRSDNIAQGTHFSAAAISGAGKLTKTGNGTLTLTATNTYTGATTISGGELTVNGSIADSAVTVQSGAVLSGSGTVGATTITSGGTIAPGNSPGIQSINGDLIWNGGGNYDWEIFNLAGPAGTGWDVIDVSDQLLLGSLSSGNKFNINIYSLSGINPDVPGALSGWDSSATNSWTIVRTTNGITGFDAANFNVNTAGFTAYNNVGTGLFALALDGNDLKLVFSPGATPVPEPGTWAAGALLALAAGLAARRRARRSKACPIVSESSQPCGTSLRSSR